ncbi:Zinc phosphodiesterase ELAC protein 1 [Psilocybe cubensis]|nr:Zinc phosphodiesterase ELAC protein 1 [Psilocybe cubensis]KAH9483778.1 Zinc phosphodiesterase ELAC protein 1 [Psilocybe cubensis]
MHADHIMGVITLLRNLLYRTKVILYPGQVITKPAVQLFGPAGLRTFVRQNLKYTLTRAADRYCVHELLTVHDSITPCDPIPEGSTSFHSAEANIMHNSELPGLDIRAGPDGLWRALTEGPGRMSKILVDAGPILHRDPCIGYVFQEAWYPSRKVVILGDTHNPEAMIPLCSNPAPSLLVHEATDSHISPTADAEGKLSRRSAEKVLETALSLGHSTPEMAGAFAKRVGAQKLVLNHIGARFPAPRNNLDHDRKRIIRDITKKASMAWGPNKAAVAAVDFLRVEVPIDPSLKDTRNQPTTRTEVGIVNDIEPNPPGEIQGASSLRDYQFYDSEPVEYVNPNAVASTSTSQAGHIQVQDGGRSAFVAYDPSGQNRRKRRRKH